MHRRALVFLGECLPHDLVQDGLGIALDGLSLGNVARVDQKLEGGPAHPDIAGQPLFGGHQHRVGLSRLDPLEGIGARQALGRHEPLGAVAPLRHPLHQVIIGLVDRRQLDVAGLGGDRHPEDRHLDDGHHEKHDAHAGIPQGLDQFLLEKAHDGRVEFHAPPPVAVDSRQSTVRSKDFKAFKLAVD